MTDALTDPVSVGQKPELDTAALTRALGGTLLGENRPVSGLGTPEDAGPGAVAVVFDVKSLPDHAALAHLGALVVPETAVDALSPLPCPVIAVPDAKVAFARLTALFAPPPPPPSISERAAVHPDARLGERVSVGAGAVVGAGVRLGDGCRVGPGCVLGEGATVGRDALLHANVTLYPGVRVGARAVLHSGVVVGADGFGYAFGPQGAVKIHHHGTVVLEDDVEVGANTCIDRGTLGETRIGARSKIDNLCQIGHNVVLGPDCLIAGATAVGGSTTLGRGVVLGGKVGVNDHVRIGDGARVAGGAGVTKSVPAGETWAGFPAQPHRRWVREHYLLGKLELVWAYVKGHVKEPKARD